MAKAQRAQTPAPTSKKSAEAGTSAPATGTDRVAARAYNLEGERLPERQGPGALVPGGAGAPRRRGPALRRDGAPSKAAR